MLNHPLVGSRLRIVPLTIVVLVAAGLSGGCRKNKGPNGDAIKQSIAALRPQFDEAKRRFMDLRERVESVPPDLDGFGEARARFYAAEEARGVTEARLLSLSERLDAALAAGNRDELHEIANDVARTHEDLRKIDELHTKLLHEVMSFQRKARQVVEAPPPAPSPTPASVKTKRTKSN